MTILSGSLAASALEVLAVPAAMMLDNVLFSGPEVPTSIRIGGSQGLVTHHLPGGQRIIDLMGADESAIQWTGLFVGPAASAKAMLLSAMRREGGVRQLTFGDIVVSVIITRFDYAYQSQGLLIPYLLRAEVAPIGNVTTAIDQVSNTTVQADVNSGAAMTENGLQTMYAYSGMVTPSISQSLTSLSGSLATADVDLSGMLTSTSTASSMTLSSAQQALDACLATPGTAAPVALNDVGSASNFISMLLTCSVSAMAASARGYAARAYVNSL